MAAFRIAGGLLLFSIASEMVLGLRIVRDARAAKQALDENIHDPAAFPLAIPLMAGPGAIAATLLLAGRAQGDYFSLALLIAAMILLMRAVNRHYVDVTRETALDRPIVSAEITEPIVVLPIDRWSRITEKAVCFALSMSSDIRCIHVLLTDETDQFCDEWEQKIAAPLRASGKPVPRLVTVRSPYRYILQPVVDYVLSVESETDFKKVCVIVPELVVRHWWDNLLHNRRADLLKVMLLMRGNRRIIVINIPWYLERD